MKKKYEKELSPAQLAVLSDNEIDTSDIPELDERFWRDAKLTPAPGKQAISLRLDDDLLAWFKAQGRGYQTRINAVLRHYMENADR